ncbi:MAG: DJ-1 family glyoxalase III [Poseidonibacter sp.]|uniref:DJ-1 family glyoxalase III n=1 Tax=Poseidonibacter sp. TaxID=2321188 RepID=UPI00359ECED5
MTKLIIIISNGFEEIETISVIDVCRRASIDVTIVAVEQILTIGANNITIKADYLINDINPNNYDMIVLPGGLPNAYTLAQNEDVQNILKNMKKENKRIAAICAAPYALHTAGVLNKNFTCYPGFEEKIRLDGYHDDKDVIVDGKIITSRGPGTAMNFALEIVKILTNENTYLNVKNGLLVK